MKSLLICLLFWGWAAEGAVKSSLDDAKTLIDLKNENILLNFCCLHGAYFDLAKQSCVYTDELLKAQFHSHAGEPIEDVSFVNVSRPMDCPIYFLHSEEFHLMPTGQLMVKVNTWFEGENGTLIEPHNFCLTWTKNNNNNGTFDMTAIVCFPEEKIEAVSTFRRIVHNYVLPISMGVSAVFLAATFFVYCVVSELRKDLLGKSFMCAIVALFLANVFGLISKAFSSHLTSRVCIAIALLMHTSFLHAFFWLNVISFILFFSIYFHGRVKRSSTRNWLFGFACSYAFLLPMLILTLVLIHDFTTLIDNHILPKPAFGVTGCGYSARGAQVVYFYAPIAVLLGINMILFCASACRLFILTKQSTAFVFQFNHYLKLLVLMGIPWIFEVLSFFLAENEFNVAAFIWLAFDMFNALQGVIIFVVFTCRRSVFASLSQFMCGEDYAREKYADVFAQQSGYDDMQNGCVTQDLRMVDHEATLKQNNDNSPTK